ncbi:unnamed protein product [Pocillopora meandrina]|uniref:Transmembrane protein 263 n=1 Tax=Pocillopora meandrina TaxID=46732 RepID=A0AAU9W9V0_9CNID|nr:unnamed protein product [Pocillopora meandrina]
MVSDGSAEQQIVARRTNSTTSDTSEKNFVMKEKDENSKDMHGEAPSRQSAKDEATSPEQQPGFLWKVSGGVYNKAATVVGGVGWVAGTALSTTFSAVSAVGGVALTPFKKSAKDKSD